MWSAMRPGSQRSASCRDSGHRACRWRRLGNRGPRRAPAPDSPCPHPHRTGGYLSLHPDRPGGAMSRDLTPDFAAALAARDLRPVIFYEGRVCLRPAAAVVGSDGYRLGRAVLVGGWCASWSGQRRGNRLRRGLWHGGVALWPARRSGAAGHRRGAAGSARGSSGSGF